MTKLIVNLDKLNLRDLFEACYERARDIVKRAVRLAVPCKIKIHATVYELDFTISGKSIGDHGQPLISLYIAGAFEEFIKDRAHAIF